MSKDNSYNDDPYGTIISQQEQSGLNNPWKVASGYLDSSTGLYKYGTRYYDPTLGRWTQLDSAGTGYVYAGDDPVNLVDPSGRDCQSAVYDAFWQVAGTFFTVQQLYNIVIPAILAASFFPPAAATTLAGLVAWVLLFAGAYEILHIIDALLPQCGINFSFGY
ncbi:MAG: RHS repeat-associated core domain-containing protein [Ktedonobacteraceae bacterium]